MALYHSLPPGAFAPSGFERDPTVTLPIPPGMAYATAGPGYPVQARPGPEIATPTPTPSSVGAEPGKDPRTLLTRSKSEESEASSTFGCCSPCTNAETYAHHKYGGGIFALDKPDWDVLHTTIFKELQNYLLVYFGLLIPVHFCLTWLPMVHFTDRPDTLTGWIHSIFLSGLLMMLLAESGMLYTIQTNVAGALTKKYQAAGDTHVPVKPQKWQLNMYHYSQLFLGRVATCSSYLNICCMVVMHEEHGWSQLFLVAFVLLVVARALTIGYQCGVIVTFLMKRGTDKPHEGLLARAAAPLDNFAISVVLGKYLSDKGLDFGCGLSAHKVVIGARLLLEDLPQFVLQIIWLVEDGTKGRLDLLIFAAAIFVGIIVLWRDFSGLVFRLAHRRVSDAARDGDFESAKALVRNGESATDLDSAKMNTLHHAATSAKLNGSVQDASRMISFLVSKGVKINAFDLRGYSPLHYAATWLHHNTCEALIQHGGDAAQREHKHGNSALLLAVGSYRPEDFKPSFSPTPDQCMRVCDVLIKGRGAWTNERNFRGESAVQVATGFVDDHDASVKNFLISHGANPERGVFKVPEEKKIERPGFVADNPRSTAIKPGQYPKLTIEQKQRSRPDKFDLPHVEMVWTEAGKCRFKKMRGNVVETMENIHGLATKDAVKYTKGLKGGLEGLTDGGTYYVRRVAANQFQLCKSEMDAEAGEKVIECRGGSDTNFFTKQ
mmetsp:Transcript_34701/g.76017  ORF Transcript_34701/g.76017 Transcript_34701/m.76017 type:complete len:720 (-) Transcript_34701:353-2512(-)|eukprot:CAMPEP_0204310912 /NCGR_PEP_ID=MMETSP0469-20131031/2013_1 /ASSEMBLY_ACC=CAM_ASM_000384 /TAXON_ID=2969 /ORGANISM="Oxyrrhis marina" /LENGTH=719 /DNA_ID=CAMNT_0051290767 /DNA_START=43 /DNA_END=2202 /DNA_ORIENTATION=-